MFDIKEVFKKNYLNKIKESDYVGIEIEIPIINLSNKHIIDKNNIQEIFLKLTEIEFKPIHYDNNGYIISLKNKIGDTISLEYSLNTIEFSLNKEINILKQIQKFEVYYNFIQKNIKKNNYQLVPTGINPYYKQIDKQCLNEDRYKIIEKLLYDKNNIINGQFCAYCCSTQTHINVSPSKLIDTLNLFTIINKYKEKIFSNSYMKETKLKNSRKYLWNKSNFGPFNTGENKLYTSQDEIINDYINRSLFYVKRKNKFYLLKNKYSLNEYFKLNKVIIIDENGNDKLIKPLKKDFQYFRSYKDVEITRYGTLEIRTDCTQELENLFKVVAFNVGISTISQEILKYMNQKKLLNKKILYNFAIKGLIKRGYNEERILQGDYK